MNEENSKTSLYKVFTNFYLSLLNLFLENRLIYLITSRDIYLLIQELLIFRFDTLLIFVNVITIFT